MSDLYIARNSAVAARALGGNVIVMSAESSLFTLNEVASAIWNAADGVTTLSSIVSNVVCEQFEVEPEEALRDAEELVHNLASHGILTISEQPIASRTGA